MSLVYVDAHCFRSFFFSSSRPYRDLVSFPTRRSSDLHPRGPRWRSAGSRQRAGRSKRSSLQRSWCRLRTCRSEEHTSELQSRGQLVCRLLLEKKKKKYVACSKKLYIKCSVKKKLAMGR